MSNKAVLTATVLTMAGLLATNQAYATPVTFFGEDPNATGGTPIAHPVSDATRASFLTNLSSPGTETFDSFSPGATNVAANFGDGVTAHLSGGVIQNFSSAGRFAISSPTTTKPRLQASRSTSASRSRRSASTAPTSATSAASSVLP